MLLFVVLSAVNCSSGANAAMQQCSVSPQISPYWTMVIRCLCNAHIGTCVLHNMLHAAHSEVHLAMVSIWARSRCGASKYSMLIIKENQVPSTKEVFLAISEQFKGVLTCKN